MFLYQTQISQNQISGTFKTILHSSSVYIKVICEVKLITFVVSGLKRAKPLECFFKIWLPSHIGALWVYLLVAEAAAAAAAAGPPVWAGGGTAVPPGRRQQGRWLMERRSRWAESSGEAGRVCKLISFFLKTTSDGAAFPPTDLLELGDVLHIFSDAWLILWTYGLFTFVIYVHVLTLDVNVYFTHAVLVVGEFKGYVAASHYVT